MPDASNKNRDNLRWLKRWIWLYFWLLIFEGALRKWAFTSLSGPLILVRDPVALIIYIEAYRCHKLSMKTIRPIAFLTVVLVALAGAQILMGVATPAIALFGLHSYVLHLPLIFIMAETLGEEDLRKFGRWLLLLSIPMMFLVLAQFRAQGNSWLNAGAGEGSGQILSAGNHVRPAGTFSYGIGMQGFIMLVAAYLLDALSRKSTYPRWLIYSALFATVATIPLLSSRTVLFTMVILAAFTVFAGMSQASRTGGVLKVVAVVLLAGLVAIQFPFFNDAVDTFSTRWQQAEHAEGDVQGVLGVRMLGPIEAAFDSAASTPLLGSGMGNGSNYAAVSTGRTGTFLLGESEWERVMLEMGPICGLLFMGSRVAFVIYLVLQAKRALRRNQALAWLLVPTAAPLLLMGIMEQTTYLGFMVFGSGLCLAAARTGGPLMRRAPYGAVRG